MSRLRDGYMITGTGDDRAVFAIISGSPHQIEAEDGPLSTLAPGYYSISLAKVPTQEAEEEVSRRPSGRMSTHKEQ